MLDHLRDLLARLAPTSILLISDSVVAPLHAGAVRSTVHGLAPLHEYIVPAGEQSKSLEQLTAIFDEFLKLRIVDRKAVVLALGGGVVGDLAGFFAATLLRGVRCIHLPTSLVAMIDSSIGGKTALNHATGKNLIGAFHQPVGVICELEFLKSLPDREYASALAEVVKTACVGDAPFFAWLESNAAAILKRESRAITRITQTCIKFKAEVVAEDETETKGRRAILNFGHTVAHALETLLEGRYLHGEAVAIGLAAAARLSVARAGLEVDFAQRLASLLARFGLPVELPPIDPDALLQVMAADKKRSGAKVNFVVLRNPGHAEVMPMSLDEKLIKTLAGK